MCVLSCEGTVHEFSAINSPSDHTFYLLCSHTYKCLSLVTTCVSICGQFNMLYVPMFSKKILKVSFCNYKREVSYVNWH